MPAKRMIAENSTKVTTELVVNTVDHSLDMIIFTAQLYATCLTIIILIGTFLFIRYLNSLSRWT